MGPAGSSSCAVDRCRDEHEPKYFGEHYRSVLDERCVSMKRARNEGCEPFRESRNADSTNDGFAECDGIIQSQCRSVDEVSSVESIVRIRYR